jgi:hypothetical protein
MTGLPIVLGHGSGLPARTGLARMEAKEDGIRPPRVAVVEILFNI